MTILTTGLRMFLGLFVDDGSLALAIIVIVLLSWIYRRAQRRVPKPVRRDE